jgi:shikimate 5-dehydrogenase
LAAEFGELSSISKKNGKLCGHAKDPITAGLSLDEFIPENYFRITGAQSLLWGRAAAQFQWDII